MWKRLHTVGRIFKRRCSYQKHNFKPLVFRFCYTVVFCIVALWTCHQGSKSNSGRGPISFSRHASHLLYPLIENSSKFLKLFPGKKKRLYSLKEMSCKVPCKLPHLGSERFTWHKCKPCYVFLYTVVSTYINKPFTVILYVYS